MKSILRLLFAAICLVNTFSGTAQIPDSTTIRNSNISFAFNGTTHYPGAQLGLELPVIHRELIKNKKSGKTKNLIKERLISGRLSWYHHPDFHDNLYLTAGYTLRRSNKKGFFVEFNPGLGVSRTFLGGTTYQVDDDGNVSVKKLAGHFYPLLSAGGGLGHNFRMSHQKPVAVFARMNLIAMFPYNSTLYLRPALLMGLTYTPSNFLQINCKTKTSDR